MWSQSRLLRLLRAAPTRGRAASTQTRRGCEPRGGGGRGSSGPVRLRGWSRPQVHGQCPLSPTAGRSGNKRRVPDVPRCAQTAHDSTARHAQVRERVFCVWGGQEGGFSLPFSSGNFVRMFACVSPRLKLPKAAGQKMSPWLAWFP